MNKQIHIKLTKDLHKTLRLSAARGDKTVQDFVVDIIRKECMYMDDSICADKSIIRFVDLFAGMGGTRIGFESACNSLNIQNQCVFTSEIKSHAVKIYKENFPDSLIYGDITKIKPQDLPDFDVLLAGFPCQPFSNAGNRKGFVDTRGTLFFDIEKILGEKKPSFFILENVEGLVVHGKQNPGDKIGGTLKTIIEHLEALDYNVSWSVLDATNFGLPQKRNRVYIVGSRFSPIPLTGFTIISRTLSDFLEKGKPVKDSDFTRKLLNHYSVNDLPGKSIKDKRGQENNIHSWDIEIKGKTTTVQRKLLSRLLKERRKKKWAVYKEITWMDGMPLTLNEIVEFSSDDKELSKFKKTQLKEMLDDLVTKGYLTLEHPKEQVVVKDDNGRKYTKRVQKTTIDKGYNIVVGKLSFEFNKILDPNGYSPTLVATDVNRLGVVDGKGIRHLTPRECLNLSGFPDWYSCNTVSLTELYDLIGNTVMTPVVKEISKRILTVYQKQSNALIAAMEA